jgi:hypothetical protein
LNLNSLTYKQKVRYLLIGAVLFLLIAYLTTIKNTIQLYRDNNRLESMIGKAENAPQGIAELRKTLEGLNLKLNNYLVDTTKEHEHTLEVVSEFCHKKRLVVRELPKRKISSENDFVIITSELRIEGSFISLLQLLYELEYTQKLGRLSSVSWKSYIDTKTKRTVLVMIVYLQNIAVNKENSKQDEKKS